MPRRKILWAIGVSLFLATNAYADLYFEQKVHTSKELTGSRQAPVLSGFERKVYLFHDIFALQIIENNRLAKEYGFDFEKNLYYEADPDANYYKIFDLGLLGKAFKRMSHEPPLFRGSNVNLARDLSRAVSEGSVDYPIRVRPSFFGKRDFGARKADLYKFRAGPGSFFFNPFGWYHRAEIWATTDVPGYAEYKGLGERLREKVSFYKIKHNQISDLIMILQTLPAFPLQIDSVVKNRTESGTVYEKSADETSHISTQVIDPARLLYVSERQKFSWDVVFSEGTNFGRDILPKHGTDFKLAEFFSWLIIPGLFFLFTYLWFGAGYAEKDRLSLSKFLVLRMYILFAILFAFQITHWMRDIPYLISPAFELSFIFIVGVIGIAFLAKNYLKDLDQQMREAYLRYCPHCHERIEVFYIVCPKCKHPL